MRKFSKISIMMLLSTMIILEIKGQDLPQIQKASLRAPANVKIDGQLNEWTDKNLLAYNSTSRIYYAVSNDDDNLYLTIRGLGTRVIVKLLSGGVTFTISHTTEKKTRSKDPKNVSIAFPLPQDNKTVDNIMAEMRTYNQLYSNIDANKKKIDSIQMASNNKMRAVVKEIKITGISQITDSVISIYNTNGIKAAMLLDIRQPIVELAIPLKYLGLSITEPSSFSYNIKIGGEMNEKDQPPIILNTQMSPDELYLLAPTDFWSEYILLKKP